MADGALTLPSLHALPWLLLAQTHADTLRASPALSRLWSALDAALFDIAPVPPLRVLEQWQRGAALAVRDLPDPPRAPYAYAWVLLCAVRAALTDCDERARVAPVVAAIDALDVELAHELRGHLRWSVSVHAVERWIERIEPTADAPEAVASIARLASRAVWLRKVRGADGEGDEYVSPDDVRVALVVSREGVVMTVVKRAMDAKVLRMIRANGTKGGVR